MFLIIFRIVTSVSYKKYCVYLLIDSRQIHYCPFLWFAHWVIYLLDLKVELTALYPVKNTNRFLVLDFTDVDCLRVFLIQSCERQPSRANWKYVVGASFNWFQKSFDREKSDNHPPLRADCSVVGCVVLHGQGCPPSSLDRLTHICFTGCFDY